MQTGDLQFERPRFLGREPRENEVEQLNSVTQLNSHVFVALPLWPVIPVNDESFFSPSPTEFTYQFVCSTEAVLVNFHRVAGLLVRH